MAYTRVYPPIHHWSQGQLGLRVAGFSGHWVAGSQKVTQFHVWPLPQPKLVLD